MKATVEVQFMHNGKVVPQPKDVDRDEFLKSAAIGDEVVLFGNPTPRVIIGKRFTIQTIETYMITLSY